MPCVIVKSNMSKRRDDSFDISGHMETIRLSNLGKKTQSECF